MSTSTLSSKKLVDICQNPRTVRRRHEIGSFSGLLSFLDKKALQLLFRKLSCTDVSEGPLATEKPSGGNSRRSCQLSSGIPQMVVLEILPDKVSVASSSDVFSV